MEITTSWTAIRTDRARSAVHGGALLASGTRSIAPKTANGALPMTSFACVSAYVVDQGSHPPRGNSPV